MQSKTASIVEVVVSTLVAFLISTVLQYAVVPLWWPESVTRHSLRDSVGITGFFTLVSLVRSYATRRLFNRWHG